MEGMEEGRERVGKIDREERGGGRGAKRKETEIEIESETQRNREIKRR